MMKVLVDANVIINFLTRREDKYRESSIQVMDMCADKMIEGYIAFHSLSILWYFAGRQKLPEETKREWLDLVCSILTTASANHDSVVEAVHNVEFRDFEDNLQEICARSIDADYIVTVNTKDYERSSIKAVTPIELVQIVKGRSSHKHSRLTKLFTFQQQKQPHQSQHSHSYPVQATQQTPQAWQLSLSMSGGTLQKILNDRDSQGRK